MGLRAWLGFGEKSSAARMSASGSAGRFSTLGWEEFPWWAQSGGSAGLRISREQALSVPPVLRGRNLIAGIIASMPLCVMNPQQVKVASPLLTQIDPDVPNIVTIAQTIEDLLFEAISWWRVTARDFAGYPTSAQHISVRNVTWQMPNDFPLNRLPSNYYPGSHAFIPTQFEAVPARDMIRFDSPNPPLLEFGSRAIRRAMLLEVAADNFAENPAMREYFTPAEDADPKDADVTSFLDRWKAARQVRTSGYVPNALVRHEVTQLSPVDLQLATLMEKATVGLANLMGLDPEDFGVSTTSRTYKNQVDARQDRINECYGVYAAALSDRLSMGDVTRRGQKVHVDWDGFLKANPVDRAHIQQAYQQMGAITTDEIREEEHRPPLTDGQRAQIKADQPQAPAQAPIPAGEGIATVTHLRPLAAAGARTAARFAAEKVRPGITFDTAGVANAFAVNEQKRTITGLVVPWDRIGRSDGQRWKFAPGSLQFDASQANRIKLLADHDQSLILGRVERTWADGVGQWATFKVRRGPAGDQALADAADGVKDGLSVGIGYDGDPTSITFGVDPDPDPSGPALYVTAVPWRETSQVGMPAFDDARISAVSMSADQSQTIGALMKCTVCGQEHAPGIACPQAPAPTIQSGPAPATFSGDQVAAMFAAMQSGQAPAAVAPQAAVPADLTAQLTAMVDAAFAKFAADNGVEKPSTVNPVRPGEVAKVDEKPLYRFDGKAGQRNFTADVANGFSGDPELQKKAEAFIAEQMGAQFANISVSNVGTMNPTIQRPDLWVPSLHFTRAIGGMVQGGVVDSVTPQRLPKFSTSSGLAGTHTEGTEPTDGAFTTTSQDITPRAISGRVTIDREVIDQGGTPQTDQIIWNEMTQFYAELLEERLVAMFVALSLSDTPVVGNDTDLQAALSTLFAGLQFVKGGDRYRGLALNQDIYTAITGAIDMNGRPLFPMLNPNNSIGTVATDWSNVRVGSKVGVPAWALASGNSGPDKSFLFVPESTYQWFSPPRRIDLDRVAVATVGIGIWGYSAEFVSRNSDVKQLAWTAS